MDCISYQHYGRVILTFDKFVEILIMLFGRSTRSILKVMVDDILKLAISMDEPTKTIRFKP